MDSKLSSLRIFLDKISLFTLKGIIMDLLLEKRKIKEEIDKIDDITIIATIEDIINFNTARNYSLEPLTKDDIINRAIESENAINNNEFITMEAFEENLKSL